ncbi:MAG: hypothetical protein ACPG77_16385 [Nannocystaceae bacterium]
MRTALVGTLQSWVRVRVAKQRERLEDRLASTTNAVLEQLGLDISVENLDPRTGRPRPITPITTGSPGISPAAVATLRSALGGMSSVAGGVASAVGGVASAVGGVTTAVGGVGTTLGNVAGVASDKIPGVGGLLGSVGEASRRAGSAASHAGKLASAVGGVGSLLGTSLGNRPVRQPSSLPSGRRVIRREPLARPKSSLDMLRKPGRRRPKSYADLAVRQTAGMQPHEILMKVATYQLGQMLLGVLQRSAQAQLDATTAAKRRLTERQILLLSKLPMAILERILANVPAPDLPAAPRALASAKAKANANEATNASQPAAPDKKPQPPKRPGSFRY